MKFYEIIWESGLRSDNPLEAAKQAREDIINGESLQFTVVDTSTGKKYSVDLYENDDDAVLEINN